VRESLGVTKPEGAMKVKARPRAGLGGIRVRPRAARRTTGPSRSSRRRGGARAYTLGPERW
jgi:hypothetical protein